MREGCSSAGDKKIVKFFCLTALYRYLVRIDKLTAHSAFAVYVKGMISQCDCFSDLRLPYNTRSDIVFRKNVLSDKSEALTDTRIIYFKKPVTAKSFFRLEISSSAILLHDL